MDCVGDGWVGGGAEDPAETRGVGPGGTGLTAVTGAGATGAAAATSGATAAGAVVTAAAALAVGTAAVTLLIWLAAPDEA